MMVTVTINNTAVEVEENTSVLTAARQIGVKIPTLCYNEHLSVHGGCRICMVEDTGTGRLVPACSTIVTDGLVVDTESKNAVEARRFIAALLLSRASDSPEIQELASELGLDPDSADLDPVSHYLLKRSPEREHTKCILCSLCVRACAEIPERHAISVSGRGMARKVVSPFLKISEMCIGCGSCVYVCPTDAILIEEAD